jgi:hypothetical protein
MAANGNMPQLFVVVDDGLEETHVKCSLGWQCVGFGSGRAITRPPTKMLRVEIYARTCTYG